MAGSTFGQNFKVTTFGESHGPAIGCIVDGCPAGFCLSQEVIQQALDRRRPGQSQLTSQRKESDTVEIISGLYEGKTLGSPIMLMIKNENARSSDYEAYKEIFRPGHGDYTYQQKYGHRDHRGGGRASARETAARVAAGAIAQAFLKAEANITIRGHLAQMGHLKFDPTAFDWEQVEHYINELRREKNAIGARVNVEAQGVPAGLGEPVFDKLSADIAKAMMSINAVKGVEIGDGFDVVTQKSTEHRDEMTPDGFTSNHAGGILAGISTGQPIVVSLAIKPTSSVPTPCQSVNKHNEPITVSVTGRHDPCIGIRAVPVAEAMLSLVIMDHWLQRYGQVKGNHA